MSILYKPGLTWAQLFGDKVTFDLREWAFHIHKNKSFACPIEENQTQLGQLWLDYILERSANLRSILGLQGWQVISSEQPHESVRMIAELQLVLEPYFAGRAVSHMLFKIARCDTGSMEMVRDFFQEYFHKEVQRYDERLQAVMDIAMSAITVSDVAALREAVALQDRLKACFSKNVVGSVSPDQLVHLFVQLDNSWTDEERISMLEGIRGRVKDGKGVVVDDFVDWLYHRVK